MKTLKLVAGIIALVFSIFILFQSCAAGLAGAFSSEVENSGGMAGFFVALLLIAGGIVMICTRKSEKNGGSIACVILFGLAAMIGFPNAEFYKDLKFWAFLALAMAVLNLIACFTNRKKKKSDVPEAPEDQTNE